MTDENHRTRWTERELALLLEHWDGTHEMCELIAEELGRTPAAVSQRYYETQWGTAPPPAKSKDMPLLRRKTTTTTTTVTEWVTDVCPVCFEMRSLNGSCACT